MRFQSLLALTAVGALMLPMAANAGSWPEGKKGAYMDQCVQTASVNGLDAKAAKSHCECGAQAIEKNFSTKEIQDLDSKDGVDANLMKRAKAAVQAACVTK